ncbi:hypothetical protein MCHI_002801 [Candidatus Magnetoovum chiemensis]|nr:hypothetical protein MCHI_002801 [Candidatus Magnetoovum chiemensis]
MSDDRSKINLGDNNIGSRINTGGGNLNQTFYNYDTLPAPVKPPMILPSRPAHFTNRENEIATLKASLQPCKPFVLSGVGV